MQIATKALSFFLIFFVVIAIIGTIIYYTFNIVTPSLRKKKVKKPQYPIEPVYSNYYCSIHNTLMVLDKKGKSHCIQCLAEGRNINV